MQKKLIKTKQKVARKKQQKSYTQIGAEKKQLLLVSEFVANSLLATTNNKSKATRNEQNKQTLLHFGCNIRFNAKVDDEKQKTRKEASKTRRDLKSALFLNATRKCLLLKSSICSSSEIAFILRLLFGCLLLVS